MYVCTSIGTSKCSNRGTVNTPLQALAIDSCEIKYLWQVNYT